MVNTREEELRTLTGCQDIDPWARAVCQCSLTGCASEFAEDFPSLLMFKSDLRATEFKSLGGAQKVSKCSQNDYGQ